MIASFARVVCRPTEQTEKKNIDRLPKTITKKKMKVLIRSCVLYNKSNDDDDDADYYAACDDDAMTIMILLVYKHLCCVLYAIARAQMTDELLVQYMLETIYACAAYIICYTHYMYTCKYYNIMIISAYMPA